MQTAKQDNSTVDNKTN